MNNTLNLSFDKNDFVQKLRKNPNIYFFDYDINDNWRFFNYEEYEKLLKDHMFYLSSEPLEGYETDNKHILEKTKKLNIEIKTFQYHLEFTSKFYYLFYAEITPEKLCLWNLQNG